MAVSMTIKKISQNIQSLLESLKGESNENVFVTVLSSPPESENSFNGYPAASHYYVNTDPTYATVSQNRRIIEYLVEIYVVSDKATKMEDLLVDELYPLADRVIQMFDESIDLSNSSLGLTKACDIMRPAPADITRIATEEGDGWQINVRLFCEADITFRNTL